MSKKLTNAEYENWYDNGEGSESFKRAIAKSANENPVPNPLCANCSLLQAGNERLKEIIEKYARHKHDCFMGEYNTIKTGKGCTCGLSQALREKP